MHLDRWWFHHVPKAWAKDVVLPFVQAMCHSLWFCYRLAGYRSVLSRMAKRCGDGISSGRHFPTKNMRMLSLIFGRGFLGISICCRLIKFCPRQRSCPGQVACSKKVRFLRKSSPQTAKLPGTSGLFKKTISEKKFCPRQRSCPGQVACSKKVRFLRKSSAPGSEAARDKWLVQQHVRFLRKSSAPGSEAARDKWLVQKV